VVKIGCQVEEETVEGETNVDSGLTKGGCISDNLELTRVAKYDIFSYDWIIF
jgi:hypothetical protein